MNRLSDKVVKRMASAGLKAVIRNGASSVPLPERPTLSPTLLEGAITGVAAADAALAEPIVWSWQDYFTEGSAVEVFGKSTSGKTTFTALVVAAMVAPPDAPVELFGRKVTPMLEGKVALVVFDENSRASATAKLDLAIEALGIDRAYAWSRILLFARSGLHATAYSGEEGSLEKPEPHDRWGHVMRAAMVDKVFGLIVLDTRARIFGPLGASADEETQALVADTIAALASGGAPVLVLSHPRKGGGESLEDISGSAQRAAGTDSALSVVPIKEGGQTTASTVTLQKSRDEPDAWPEKVTFTLRRQKGGGVDFTWKAGRDRTQATGSQEKVLEALASGPKTKSEIRKLFPEMNISSITKATDALVAEARIAKGTKVVKKQVRETFELAADWKDLVPEESEPQD